MSHYVEISINGKYRISNIVSRICTTSIAIRFNYTQKESGKFFLAIVVSSILCISVHWITVCCSFYKKISDFPIPAQTQLRNEPVVYFIHSFLVSRTKFRILFTETVLVILTEVITNVKTQVYTCRCIRNLKIRTFMNR